MKAAERNIGTILSNLQARKHITSKETVEFCCGENSKTGQRKYQRDGCSVTRLTLEDDVATNRGLRIQSY